MRFGWVFRYRKDEHRGRTRVAAAGRPPGFTRDAGAERPGRIAEIDISLAYEYPARLAPSDHLVKKEAPGSRFCPHSIFSKSRLSASLPGSLAASDALGLARSGFEATPVVDADHGVSEL